MEKNRKNVLITGSSSGLGKETARVFARNNYNVIVTYLSHEDEALSLKNELEINYGVQVLCVKCDISKEEDVLAMINIIKKEFCHIHCLVNNAAISNDSDISEKSALDFKRVVDVNLVGTFIVTKYISELMESGVIINISSTDGIDTCYKEEMDYAASKAGIISLTKTMAKKFSPNIRVNCVAPGWINTDVNKDLYSEFKEKEIDKILLKRFAEPKEIANVIYFLATPEASYINGTVIRVDGGY